MPWFPGTDDQGDVHHNYEITSYWEHMVADYCRISMFEVEDLDYIDYLRLRRDAFITMLSQTEKGQEYLDNAWILEQTAPDKKSLRDQFGE